MISNLLQDGRYALRALAKRPGYATLIVLVLVLAIGANSTVFSVLNGFFLRPLPYPDDERLVVVSSSYPKMGIDYAGTSVPDYLDRRAQAPSLEDLAIVAPGSRTLDGEGLPQQIEVVRASASLFNVLGIAPALGRVFTADEDTPGDHRVIVLSHALWQSRFGGRGDVVGRDVRLDGETYRIVGVMPETFGFPNRDVEAYVPFAYTPAEAADDQRGRGFAMSVGRLRQGATLLGLEAELDAIIQRTKERLPQAAAFMEAAGFTGRARTWRDMAVAELAPMLLVLQGVVLTVLLIACANVANLQLSRFAARRKELSVRSALGAGLGNLVRLVLVESAVLAALGGLGGVLLARAGIALVRALGLDRGRDGFELAVDPTVLGFTAGVALLAAWASSTLPLVALAREDMARAVRDLRGTSEGRATQTFRHSLVVVQLALGVTLLAGAGLLTKSFYELQRRGPGFEAANVLTAGVSLPPTRYPGDDEKARFYEQALDELRALPGVIDVGLTSVLPFSGTDAAANISIDGTESPAGAPPPTAEFRSIDAGYLPSLGIPVVQGRNFAADEPEPVVLIDENLANRFWPGGGALGQRVSAGGGGWFTIVGIVPHVKHASLAEEPGRNTVYWFYEQRPDVSSVFTLRAGIPPEQLANAARDAIARIDPTLALDDMLSMDERVLRSLGPQRAPMALTLVFAAIAVSLAVVGIYGVLSWSVAQRVGEIGVRIALGAQIRDVVRLVLRQGAFLIALGLAFGAAGALALGRVLAAQLREVSPADPVVLIAAMLGLAATALFASWLPAWRAARIDPMQALRAE